MASQSWEENKAALLLLQPSALRKFSSYSTERRTLINRATHEDTELKVQRDLVGQNAQGSGEQRGQNFARKKLKDL